MNDNLEYDENAEDLPEASVPVNRPRDYVLANQVYDKLKPTVQVIIPGIGALYFALAVTWGLPYGEQVVATAAAVATFLGLFLVYADKSYNASEAKYDGKVVLLPGETEYTMGARVRLDDDAEHMLGKKQVLLHVDNQLS